MRRTGWTDSNVSDPGITLAELLSFLAEQVDRFRQAAEPKPTRRGVARLALALVAAGIGVAWWQGRRDDG